MIWTSVMKELMFLLLLSFYLLIFICYYLWLLFGLIGFFSTSITCFYNFCDTFLASFLSPFYHKWINCWYGSNNFNAKIDVFVDVSFRRSSSNHSRNSPSICINLIILFKNTKITCIPLHTFEKYKSTNRKITRRANGSYRD